VLRYDISKPLHLGWIKLSNEKGGLWKRAALVEEELRRIKNLVEARIKSTDPGRIVQWHVAYETPLIRLSSGKGGKMTSSAQTISTLCRFNGMIGILAAQIFKFPEPIGFGAAEARTAAKIKIKRDSDKKAKEQVFDRVCEIIGTDWLLFKRGGNAPKDECMDATDAWVIAVAGLCRRNNLGAIVGDEAQEFSDAIDVSDDILEAFGIKEVKRHSPKRRKTTKFRRTGVIPLVNGVMANVPEDETEDE
jgi:hypothetical protein